MSEENLYAPPSAELSFSEELAGGAELAGRFTRFAAAFLDGIISLAYSIPIMYLLGIWKYVSQGQNPPFVLLLASAVPNFIVFFLIHGYFLKTNGQTVGKKLAGIRIADLDGNVPDVGKVILLRYLPISIVSMIPFVGSYLPLVDVLFIFRQDRRCVHDLIAGTKVVVAKKTQ